jgi:hypothetical protein
MASEAAAAAAFARVVPRVTRVRVSAPAQRAHNPVTAAATSRSARREIIPNLFIENTTREFDPPNSGMYM